LLQSYIKIRHKTLKWRTTVSAKSAQTTMIQPLATARLHLLWLNKINNKGRKITRPSSYPKTWVHSTRSPKEMRTHWEWWRSIRCKGSSKWQGPGPCYPARHRQADLRTQLKIQRSRSTWKINLCLLACRAEQQAARQASAMCMSHFLTYWPNQFFSFRIK